jgi:tetratricopeptide (TPR) repeat protein
MKMIVSMGGNMPAMDMDMEMTVTISSEFGMKAETTTVDGNTGQKSTSLAYIIPHEKIAITLMPDKKKYSRTELDDDLLAKMKQQNNDPREMIEQMLGSEYTELGRSTIEGIEVDGFQTHDPAAIGGVGENVTLTLWVDSKTWLPVRSEMEFNQGDRMQVHCVVSEYKWDVPVAADEFKPVIPDDFQPMATGMQMPKISEEGLIEGLRLFAELTGRYPKKLSVMELSQEIMGFMTNRDALEKIKAKISEFRGLDEDELNKLDQNKVMTRTMQITQPLQSPGFFYMTLVQEKKEPVYYGQTVGPDDADIVLLRWKVSDNEYRIIFGDLSVGDATADELIDLEKSAIDDGDKTSDITEETAFEGTDKSTATDHYERGDTHYFNGEYDQAFSELTKAIEKDPDLACAYVTRGMAYNDKNEFDLAIADFTRVIEIKPMDAHAYAYRGMAYVNKGEYDLAIADCSRAIEIDPTLTDPYRLRARAYTYKGEYDKAWKDVYQAQALGQPVDSKLLEKLRKASGRDN